MQQGIDVSQYQGSINWSEVPEPIAIVKMSGGDAGLYYDANASKNYYGAKAAGKVVGMYHFAGGTSAVTEADYFVKACSPLDQNDVLIIDWEVSSGDPVGWVNTFVTEVHSKTTVWPLVYMNLATLNAYDWSSVLKNCGLWIADWSVSPNQEIATTHVYVAQQYSDKGSVPGIVGYVDLDAWFGTLQEFQAYGYHVSQNTSPPTSPQPVQPSTPQTPPSETLPSQTPLATVSSSPSGQPLDSQNLQDSTHLSGIDPHATILAPTVSSTDRTSHSTSHQTSKSLRGASLLLKFIKWLSKPYGFLKSLFKW